MTKNPNKLPKISVITIVLNNKNFFMHTLNSVSNQNYENLEYIVVDGGSIDGTLEYIKKNSKKIDKWISGKDSGIYDAMNLGLKLASGDWILFLNAGDRFSNKNVLSNILKETYSNKDIEFIYGNWYTCNLNSNPDELIEDSADYALGKILHQSVLYKKKLHEKFGNYLVTPKLIISDYIFFQSIPISKTYHYNAPISINDNTGVSSSSWSYKQKLAVDFIFNKISAKEFIYQFISYELSQTNKWKINLIHGYWERGCRKFKKIFFK